MTKTELEEAIKNGESVWEYRNYEIREINLKTMYPEMLNEYQLSYIVENNENATMCFTSIEDLYKTKAEAEHFLNHANITRTETLPFLTWEEFCGRNILKFDNKHITFYMELTGGKIRLTACGRPELNKEWKATEANFYKAYDECVKLFKGEEI